MPIKLVGGKVEGKAEKEAVKINQVIDWIDRIIGIRSLGPED